MFFVLRTDVIVHRLLEACIDQDLVYGHELTDKMRMKELCDSMLRLSA
jgi:exosome complex exonuclease DIS3/RRP44